MQRLRECQIQTRVDGWSANGKRYRSRFFIHVIMDAERTLPAKLHINNMPKDIGWRRALRVPPERWVRLGNQGELARVAN